MKILGSLTKNKTENSTEASLLNMRATLLLGTAFAAGIFAAPVAAQTASDQTPDDPPEIQTEEDEEDVEIADGSGPETVDSDRSITVVGSRLRNPVFTADQPIAIIDAETGALRGEGTVEELVRQSPLVTGSQQSDGQQSAVFIGGRATNGGNGINNVSLRGLGQERTLILLDGRRLTPSGTGGGVSTPDLAIIPSSIIQRVEILKDGASSIYGSDALAGIVDNRLVGPTNDSMITGLANVTEDGGGEFFQAAGRFSRDFGNAHFNIAAQYSRRERQRLRDRDFTDCRDIRLFDPVTDERLDIRDANGEIVCTANPFGSNNRFFLFRGGTGSFFDPASINARFAGLYIPDPDGTIIGPGQDELRAIIPEFARVGVQNLGRTSADQPTFGTAGGSFELTEQSQALLTQTSEFFLNSNAVNPFERFSVFVSGAIDLSDSVEFYGRALYSRSEFDTTSFRFLFQNLGGFHPSNTVGQRVRDATGGALFGALGFNLHLPFQQRTETDYVWLVGGFKGEFGDNLPVIGGWDWDIYANYGRSDAQATRNFTREDRVLATTGFTDIGCDTTLIREDLLEAGQTAQGLCDSIGGAIPWLSPRILSGSQFTPEEDAFLNGVETSDTLYEQVVVEGFLSGELAVPLLPQEASVALGFHFQHDSINDEPGPNSLASNNHNFSNSQPTRGDYTVKEVFGEIGLPLLEDAPGVELLQVTASGRFTDNNRVDDGGEFTYRFGGVWKPVNQVLFRANYGTSYRAPALFELFQGGTASFGAGDPCVNLQASTRPADEVANLTQNCGFFGIPIDFQPTLNVRTLNQGNDTGTLRPETSTSLNLGVVLQPDFADLSFAVDYYEIRVEDQIGRIGAQAIINRCLVNQAFDSLADLENNQFCSLLQPRDADLNLTDVINGSINIAEQIGRGIDYSVRFRHDFGDFQLGFNGTVTQVLEDFINLDRDFVDPIEDDIDRTLLALRPEWTGQFNLSLTRGPLTLFWSTTYIGESDEFDFISTDPNSFINPDRTAQFFGPYRFLDEVRPDTVVEEYWEHTASVRYNFDNLGLTLIGGVANIFDEEPPQVGNQVQRVGTSASGPYDFRGRRFFVRATKRF